MSKINHPILPFGELRGISNPKRKVLERMPESGAHYSPSGLSAAVIMQHRRENKMPFVLVYDPKMGYMIANKLEDLR